MEPGPRRSHHLCLDAEPDAASSARCRESCARAETEIAGPTLNTSAPDIPGVAIVDDKDLAPARKLAAALEGIGLADTLAREKRSPRVVIRPELAGFVAGSAAITDPMLVEALIDLLHDRGITDVTVVGTADSSSHWAENRDLLALSDLLGYGFVTPMGRSYDIEDLAEAPDATVFPPDSVLHGTGLSRTWLDADLRIVFTKCRTDEAAGYALCLDTLIGVLPLADKDLHYRRQRHPGDVVAALLDAAPVQLCLIDAIASAHGAGGRRAPETLETGTLIAASDAVLADYIGALKMGIDPAISPLFARVQRSHPLPTRYAITGPLDRYPGWTNVPAPLLYSTRMRDEAGALGRLVQPWLQRLDPELFPLKHPIDARFNATLAAFFADNSIWLLVAANALLGLAGQAVRSYRTMFDKDALDRQAVPLGIDLDVIADDAFDRLVAELVRLEPIAASAPEASPELRWRYVDEAVVFHYARTLPIGFDLFVARVDIARTIQFMNDYLGGVVVPLAHDAAGRPVRQAERNLYLPQPNYLVLYHGKPIDVSKLEVVEYGDDRHRLYWKTVASENGSATSDDGIATFERAPDGTRVSITGCQFFTLPLFWQVFDLNLVPDIKAMLVTHAYRTFFDRTIANFEALVEGRDIRIGRPLDEVALPPIEQIMPLLQRLGEIALPLIQRAAQPTAETLRNTDADGFVHITPLNTWPKATEFEGWAEEIGKFVEGLRLAAQRDLTEPSQVG
jgi:uncharacterized protein (DUF362 family)